MLCRVGIFGLVALTAFVVGSASAIDPYAEATLIVGKAPVAAVFD
jgi:hypothetical protein